MTKQIKIQIGQSYRFQNGTVAKVIAQGSDKFSGVWVRYQLANGKTGDTQLNDAINYWQAA